MNRKLILIFFFLCFILISVFILNYQYPFVTDKVGKWSVGYGFSENPIENPSIQSENIISYVSVDSLLNTKGNYIADPFFIKERDSFYLFVELKGEENADIALFTSKNGIDYRYKGVVLDESFHLSYPQIFKYREEFYMVPETKQAGNVLLYKAEDFPLKWKIEDTLLKDVYLKDPSILLSPGMNLIVTVDDHMNQLIYESDSLKGDWRKSHRFIGKKGNETRPGGRFFKYENHWYLPMQDRTYGYGSGISLYQLNVSGGDLELILSKKRFLGGIKNIEWFNRGMHHLDVQNTGNTYYMVYDGDRNLDGEKAYQFKRTLKFIYSDIYNYLNK